MTGRLKNPSALLKVESEDLKMLREDLCIAQSEVHYPSTKKRLQVLINEIDRHRPLGSDGKHGNLHTPTCGCEDK